MAPIPPALEKRIRENLARLKSEPPTEPIDVQKIRMEVNRILFTKREEKT